MNDKPVKLLKELVEEYMTLAFDLGMIEANNHLVANTSKALAESLEVIIRAIDLVVKNERKRV